MQTEEHSSFGGISPTAGVMEEGRRAQASGASFFKTHTHTQLFKPLKQIPSENRQDLSRERRERTSFHVGNGYQFMYNPDV